MPIKAVVSDINTVDESLRGHYREDNGRYILDVEPTEVKSESGVTSHYALEDVHGIKSALQKERSNTRTAQAIAEKFNGLDADDVRSSLTELETLRGQSGDAEATAQALSQSKIDQLVSKHQEALESSENTTKAYRGKVEDLMVDQTLAAAIRAGGGDEGTVTLLMPHLKAHVALRETGDNFITEVVDPLTKEPRIGDNVGSPMSMEQLIVEFRDSNMFASAFPGTGQSGGGTKSSGGKGGAGFPAKKGSFTATQRSDFIEKNGSLAWLNLPD